MPNSKSGLHRRWAQRGARGARPDGDTEPKGRTAGDGELADATGRGGRGRSERTRRAPDPLPPEREELSRERERLKEPLPLSEWELLSPGLPPPELCCEPPDEADLSEE